MKIILITHQKGGVGKSTLALNLANSLTKYSKVCIVDCDFQGSIISLKNIIQNIDIITYKNLTTIEELKQDFVIIDTPPYLSEILPGLIQKSNIIIIPTKAGIMDVLAMKQTVNLIKQNGAKGKVLAVMNMVKPNTSLTHDIIQEIKELDVNVAKTIISDLVSFTRSPLFVELDKKAREQMDSLTKEILTQLL